MTTTLTTTEARDLVLEFAKTWPTSNVLRGVRYAEAGKITWLQMAEVCAAAFADAKAAVA